MYGYESGNNRPCSDSKCRSTVPYSDRKAGYCNGKFAHWNEPTASTWARPKCECGTDKMIKETFSGSRRHAYWCDINKWEGSDEPTGK